MLTLAQFAAIVISTLVDDGIDGYLPTMYSRDNNSMRALQGVPPNVDQRKVVQDWIVGAGPPASYLFAVRSGPNEVTAGSCVSSTCEFVAIVGTGDSFDTKEIAKPEWWHIQQ